MNITVIGVGKLKEKYWKAAIEEYAKRMTRYCRIEIQEVKDEPAPETLSEKEKLMVMEKEGRRIMDRIPDSAYVIALCIEGKQMPSEKLAEMLRKTATEGKNHFVFIIGGSMGLSEMVKRRADLQLSFSPMTFPHQLMRVILLEQIYRAFTILHDGKYHK
ncbi:23S rRNA (pseudouridine(1915)-N(3))-methyltransferase RlmH [Ructibacterium gallinarum]|uniref:Ribosomal RNA large subunit methyltransferase H n=1 Tax=Ructibacterium gallinarum TaxID=2779355 RepID=A0A9D5R8M0_9FIRM|nr:23S rRNA (pseudouridine(1915)-N(3))-methyltransferase RlmH [Ructibacterium gallinarum]MBE5040107.1 23S rRNA (pseudouridine(1915)-N(3))-methyltransferase RlmH [Ructibacterium gallinarum]